jgi:hypothetical protein
MRFKKFFIIAVVIVILIAAFMAYIGVSFRSLLSTVTKPTPPPITYLNTSVAATNLLSYNLGTSLIPYALVYYNEKNISSININATLFLTPPPKSIYILNDSNSCPFNCQNLPNIISAVKAALVQYNVVGSQSQIYTIDQQDLAYLPNDSALIILGSAMPFSMYSKVNGTNQMLLSYLLNKGTDIVYAGSNFSYATQGDILINVTSSTLPTYLSWTQHNEIYSNSGFFFNYSTFSFTLGSQYGPLTYVSYGNGSILAFPNYITTWKNASDAGHDVAKSLSQLFWLPKYAFGYANATILNRTNSTGDVGVVMAYSSNTLQYNNRIKSRDQGYGRIVVYTNSTYSIGNFTNDIYKYESYKTNLTINGTMAIDDNIVPGEQILPIPTISLFLPSSQPKLYSPHIVISDLNSTRVQTIPLSSFNASGNISVIEPLTLYLPPGRYIAQVLGFYDNQYAAALFNVYPIEISLASANYTNGAFTFKLESSNTPLSNIGYNISVNKLYPANGTVSNGTIVYVLPKGSPKLRGNITFSIGMLTKVFTYSTSNSPIKIVIPSQYIELAIVVLVMFIIITVVRAPNRDEFYIDVPTMTKVKPIPIKLKAEDVVQAFDKLNVYYHWKYMPLSVAEAKIAIANNLRYNNMTVNLTHSNVDVILNQLVTAGYLVGADGLYAPKAWISQSGHDIEYLATFKKLRVYLVNHAYVFTDIDSSDKADIIATIHNERVYIVIFSQTSKFKKMPVSPSAKTYIAFLNSYKLDEFENYMREYSTPSAEELRMYISVGQVKLVDADNPEYILT